MTKVINADPRIAVPLDEDEIRRFLTGSKSLLMHIGPNDARGEPNVTPIVYYFDEGSKKIYITTHNSSKKVESLKKKNTISFVLMIQIHRLRELKEREGLESMKILIISGLNLKNY